VHSIENHHQFIAYYRQQVAFVHPPPRKRSRLALTLSEREEISRGIALQLSVRAIASQLERSPSTISREINRNGGIDVYRATQADHAAWHRAHRPKQCKLAGHLVLKRMVASKLKHHWSPKHIAGWLKRTYPFEARKQVSHECGVNKGATGIR